MAEVVQKQKKKVKLETSKSSSWCVAWMQRILLSRSFTYTILALILMNLVLLGIEVDVASGMPYGESPAWFAEINLLIVFVFICEVLGMISCFGARKFFCGREPWWNIFDFCVVVLSALEVTAEFFVELATSDMDTANLRVMRFVRIARTLRGVRVIRLLRYIGSLRTIIFSIVSTMGSLFWTLVLLVLIFYCFSVIITQSVADYCRFELFMHENSCPDELAQHWGSVGQSMLTLFLAISGGLSWGEALHPLRPVGATPYVSVMIYVVITVFAILNVVTGVFCNTAIESAGADREIAIMKQMKKQDQQVETLKEIFEEIDVDSSHTITFAELKEAFTCAKMESFMKSMGISTEDVWTLFMTVDADGSGDPLGCLEGISIEEFVHGCMQLQGPARGLQVARMNYENTVMRADLNKMREEVVKFQTEMRASQVVRSPLPYILQSGPS